VKILYNVILKNKSSGYSVTHIREVLNNLSDMGNTIITLDGIYSKYTPSANNEKSIFRVNLYKHLPSSGITLILSMFMAELYHFYLGFNIILKKRRSDVIYTRHVIFDMSWLLGFLFNIPLVKEVNGISVDEMGVAHRSNKIILWFLNKTERFTISKSNRIIVVTKGLGDLLIDKYNIANNKIIVIENGVNTDIFQPANITLTKAKLNLDIDTNYICFVGYLASWQGVEYFIKALPYVIKYFSNTKALIVGDGPMKDELAALANQLDVVDKIIFVGKIPYNQVPLYINASEICVTPKKPLRSGYSPLKLCEYLACSKPVIATRTNGFELLEENNAGLLINPENQQEFADAINMLLKDPVLRQRMGENGRKYVLEDRSWESVARKVAKVCEDAIQAHKKHNI
jgi:glycosyltransferase involved in cell wall biosynthesis